jgi:hypothetical protein
MDTADTSRTLVAIYRNMLSQSEPSNLVYKKVHHGALFLYRKHCKVCETTILMLLQGGYLAKTNADTSIWQIGCAEFF